MSSIQSVRERASASRQWRICALLLTPAVFAAFGGCAAMHLMEGKLSTKDEDDLGLVTRPYPDWDRDAKAALDRIPTAAERQRAALATAAVGTAVPKTAAISASVAPEQPPVDNPATTAEPSAPDVSAKPAESPPSAATKNPPEAVPNSTPSKSATPAPALVHPTHDNPLAVAGAEQTPVSPPVASGEKKDEKKKEPTPAERLSALLKQRSDFLVALKAEVTRRRQSTDDEEELVRLEKELRLVQLAGEQPDEAVAQIESLDGPEKDAFAHLLMGLATWMSTDEARRPTLRNAKIAREIRDAAAELAAASKLDVRNLAFCKKVESYGWYTEFPKTQFKPKQEVILYAEVENFAAVRVADESYETELQGSYQIFDSQGKLVDERELPLDLAQCRNYRRDYFLSYLIYLPDGLTPGNYRLELTVEDKKGSAIHQEPKPRRGEKQVAVKSPSSASSYKGRKLGTGTIEFAVK